MDIKELYHNDWLSLMETDGYVFSHETRSNGKIVALLVFKLKPNGEIEEVLGRFENTPCHFDGFSLSSITGGVENDDVKGTAIKELLEEAGLIADKTDLIPLGTVRPTKSTDTEVFLLGVNAEGKKWVEAKGDGSKGEKHAFCSWVLPENAINCKDPLMATMIMRYLVNV